MSGALKDGFVLQVLRPAGAAVCRLHFRRRHVVFAGGILALVFAGLFALHVQQLAAAKAELNRLQAERFDEELKLETMVQQAQMLQRQNIDSEHSIERIEQKLDVERSSAPVRPPKVHAAIRPGEGAQRSMAERLILLERLAEQTDARAQRLATLVNRVLSLRRLASSARARTLAAIPSLNPVGGGVSAAFGWRTDPWPEFHKGLDLAADWGAPVHAAAAGVVAWAGWEGGFGIKIDIDHGNGYHTWYCHLSKSLVSPGQHVRKGELIAAVGSTGESTGPHLHYQVMRDGVAIDPMPFLHGVPAAATALLPVKPAVQ